MTAGVQTFAADPILQDAAHYQHCAAITKSDTDELPNYARAIYVGGTGDIALITVNDETVTFKAVPVGTILRVFTKQVKNATTATLLIAMW